MKQWKELVIDWSPTSRSYGELSIPTKIILSSFLTTMVLLIIGIAFLEYIQRVTLAGISELIWVFTHTGGLPTELIQSITAEIGRAQFIAYCFIVLVATLIAFLSARLALKPTREALNLQRHFLAIVAHELRTPLAILKTQNEVAILETSPSSPLYEILQDNVQEINHMSEILNNSLLFHRVDINESIPFSMIDIRLVLARVAERMQKKVTDNIITLVYHDSEIPFICGNATALEQAFYNLAKNAVAYSSGDSEVKIECVAVTDSYITIRISDHGVGIADTDLPHIFEPFYRTDTATEMSKGTGLGLSIVLEIVKLHHGKIEVKSILGEGTQFDVTLPRTTSSLMSKVTNIHDFTRQKRS